jgi:hypothetical protein
MNVVYYNRMDSMFRQLSERGQTKFDVHCGKVFELNLVLCWQGFERLLLMEVYP